MQLYIYYAIRGEEDNTFHPTRSSRSPYPAGRSAEDLGPVRGIPDASASWVCGHADAAQRGDGEHVFDER